MAARDRWDVGCEEIGTVCPFLVYRDDTDVWLDCQDKMYTGTPFPIEKSDYYQEYLAEKAAIAEFKWLESERENRDIGQWRAEWLWWANHQRKWRDNYRASGSNANLAK